MQKEKETFFKKQKCKKIFRKKCKKGKGKT